jgi:hypothetical protein
MEAYALVADEPGEEDCPEDYPLDEGYPELITADC